MELDVTDLFFQIEPADLSASRAELGDHAGALTWNASMLAGAQFVPLKDGDALDAFRTFVRASGGWDDSEIHTMSADELQAMCVQWIAGDIRESDALERFPPDWSAYQAECERGNVAGRLFEGIDGRIYFYIGD